MPEALQRDVPIADCRKQSPSLRLVRHRAVARPPCIPTARCKHSPGRNSSCRSLSLRASKASSSALQLGILRQVHQVVRLVGIGLVIVEQPGAVQSRAHTCSAWCARRGIPCRQSGAPIPRMATRSKITVASVSGVLSAAHVAAVIEALDRFGYRHAAQPEQRGHEVFRVDRGIELARLHAQTLRPAQEQRHPDRLVVRPLLLVSALRAQHVPVIGGEDQQRVLRQPGFLQRAAQFAKAIIQSRAVRVIAGEDLARVRRAPPRAHWAAASASRGHTWPGISQAQ